MRIGLPVLALLVLALEGCGGQAERSGLETASRAPVRVELRPVNGSRVTGTASLAGQGDRLRVSIEASGLEPGRVHPQAVHSPGASHARLGPSGPGSCPPPRADQDGDGRISLEEGEDFFGSVALPLTPFPAANARGRLRFEESYPIGSSVELLEQGVVVLHGARLDGRYLPSAPVACGRIGPLAGAVSSG